MHANAPPPPPPPPHPYPPGAALQAVTIPANLGRVGNALAWMLGIDPYELFFYVFLPPLLLDAGVRIDYFLFKRALVQVNCGGWVGGWWVGVVRWWQVLVGRRRGGLARRPADPNKNAWFMLWGQWPCFSLPADMAWHSLTVATTHAPPAHLADPSQILTAAFLVVAFTTALMIPILLYVLRLAATGWSWAHVALLGSMLASTDAVAIVSVMKEGGGPRRLRVLLEGNEEMGGWGGVV